MAAPTDTPEQLANAELTRVLAKFMLDLQTMLIDECSDDEIFSFVVQNNGNRLMWAVYMVSSFQRHDLARRLLQ